MEKFSRDSLKITALIPARGGSKGILRKNICLVGDKPLIAWSIEAALSNNNVDKVIVSTDDDEIAEVSRAFGAEVPFIRPAELATDDSPVMKTLNHALDYLENNGQAITHLLQLNPTSPLREEKHISEAIDILLDKQADSVVSVCEAHTHPFWCKRISDKGQLVDFDSICGPDIFTNRQKLPAVYSLNGSIFLSSVNVIRSGSYYTNNTYPYIMNYSDSLDIDTSWELYLANLILKDRNL